MAEPQGFISAEQYYCSTCRIWIGRQCPLPTETTHFCAECADNVTQESLRAATEADVAAAIASAIRVQASMEVLTEYPGLLAFAEVGQHGRTLRVALADGTVYTVAVEHG